MNLKKLKQTITKEMLLPNEPTAVFINSGKKEFCITAFSINHDIKTINFYIEPHPFQDDIDFMGFVSIGGEEYDYDIFNPEPVFYSELIGLKCDDYILTTTVKSEIPKEIKFTKQKLSV